MGHNRFQSGGVGRAVHLREGIEVQVFVSVIGIAFQILGVGMFSFIMPLFSLVFGLAGIIGVLLVPKEGILYTAGWTLMSLIFAFAGAISGTELLLDLIPAFFIIASRLLKPGIYEGIGGFGVREDGGFLS